MNAAQPGRRAFALVIVVGMVSAGAVAAGLGAAPERPVSGPACGGTLWRLLTMSDADVASVQLPSVSTTERSSVSWAILTRLASNATESSWASPTACVST